MYLAYVQDTGNGEWALMLWLGNTWLNIANYDSSTSAAGAFIVDFNYTTSSPIQLGIASYGTIINSVIVKINTPFNGSPVINIGIDNNHSLLMDDNLIDTSLIGEYLSEPNQLFNNIGGTNIKGYFNFLGSTQGSGTIIVNYS